MRKVDRWCWHLCMQVFFCTRNIRHCVQASTKGVSSDVKYSVSTINDFFSSWRSPARSSGRQRPANNGLVEVAREDTLECVEWRCKHPVLVGAWSSSGPRSNYRKTNIQDLKLQSHLVGQCGGLHLLRCLPLPPEFCSFTSKMTKNQSF